MATDAQKRAHEKYFEKNYRQVKLAVPATEADLLESHCKSFGYTKAGFIREAIKEKIDRDTATKPLPHDGNEAEQ